MKKRILFTFAMALLVPLTSEAKKTTPPSPPLSSAIYFTDDSDLVTDTATLTNNAQWIKAHPDKVVILEGHCDERGTDEYNLNLGDRRARNVMKALMDLGVSEKQLILMSYGKDKPKVTSRHRQDWSQNRRVDFVIR